MIVYGSSMSPFVRKVLAFAAEKGIEVESKPVVFGSDDSDFVEASQFRKMPGFRDGDFAISDSSAIVTYLETIQPDPELIPSSPRSRARTIWYEELGDTLLCGCVAKLFFNRIVAPRFLNREGDLAVAEKAEREELPPILDYLERTLPESGFLVDDRLTLADIAVASPFVNFRHLGLTCLEGRPKLAAYVEAILARASFKHWADRETAFLARAA